MAVLTVLIGPCGVAGHKWAGNDNEAAAPAPIITAEAYKQKLQVEFNSTYDGTFMPQAVFEWVHPLGTASRIVVHDVSLSWKNGQASNSVNDLRRRPSYRLLERNIGHRWLYKAPDNL